MREDKVYRIENPSQELLIKTINTIPKEPVNGYIQFSSSGILWENFRDADKYVSYCEANNIVPYSKMTFQKFSSEGNLQFSVNQEDGLKKYLSGSKIESYLFHLFDISGLGENHKDAGARLSKIKKSYLPNLMEKGYEVSKFHLWMGSYQSNARHGTRSPSMVLNLNENSNNQLHLVVGPDYELQGESGFLEKVPEIEKWFNALQERVLFS